MTGRSFREKSIMPRTKKGSVGLSLVAAAFTVMVLVPSMIFVLKAFLTKYQADSAKEVLKIASAGACQAISRQRLGSVILYLDEAKAAVYFRESADRLLEERTYLKVVEDAAAAFSLTGNIITVNSEITIITAFGKAETVKDTCRWITETAGTGE